MAATSSIQAPAPPQASKLPLSLRFPLMIITSLSLLSLYSFVDRYASGELAAVTCGHDEWWNTGALLAWRTIELSLGWLGNYDGYEMAALTLLSHGPYSYFFYAFYPSISRFTILSSLIIDVLASSIPLGLLRPLPQVYTPWKSTNIPGRDITANLSIQILTSILAANIYSTVLSTAYASFLPVALVTHFDIPSIAAAHNIIAVTMLPAMLAFGLATRVFIFNPTIADASPSSKNFISGRTKVVLANKFKNGVSAYMPRIKGAIIRTLTLAIVTGINTFIQLSITIKGSEAVGAAAYAIVWAVAALVTGASLGIVGLV